LDSTRQNSGKAWIHRHDPNAKTFSKHWGEKPEQIKLTHLYLDIPKTYSRKIHYLADFYISFYCQPKQRLNQRLNNDFKTVDLRQKINATSNSETPNKSRQPYKSTIQR
jgi:hypothetical protein